MYIRIHRGAPQAADNVGIPFVSGRGHNAVARLVMGAGLDAGGIGIIVRAPIRGIVGQHAVGGVGRADVLRVLLGVVIVGGGSGDLCKIGQAHGILGYGDHIPGTGIVILVVQAMGIGKVGVGTSQLCRLLIHQLDKIAATGVIAAVKPLFSIGGGHIAGLRTGLRGAGSLGVVGRGSLL